MAAITTNPITTWTRGRALGAGYISRRPLAESLARIVANVAAMALPAGAGTFAPVERFAAVGAAFVWVWVPRPYTWVISLVEIAPDMSDMEMLRTVGLCPGEFRALDAVYEIKGGPLDGAACSAAEFWTAEAAVGFALEWVAAPVLATAQHDHDPFAV